MKRNRENLSTGGPYQSAERSQRHRETRGYFDRPRQYDRPVHRTQTPSRSGSHRDRAHTPENFQWREKSLRENRTVPAVSDISRPRRPPLERSPVPLEIQSQLPDPLGRQESQEVFLPTPAIPSKDQILGELRDVTVQYITCADPTESAVRRQRVLQGEANNLMSTKADKIIEAVVASAPATPSSSTSPGSKSPTSPVVTLIKDLVKQPKRGRGRPPLSKQMGKPPINLKGAKSQKRNFVKGSPKKPYVAIPKSKNAASIVGPSNPKVGLVCPPSDTSHSNKYGSSISSKRNAPNIDLIPASRKTKVDFQNPSLPLP